MTLRNRSDKSELLTGAKPAEHKTRGFEPSFTRKSSSYAPSSSASSTAEEAQSITRSLQRTKSMMKHELERVTAVSQAIKFDGELLQEARTDHMGLSSITKSARRTLGVLRRQDMQDVIILYASVAIFFAVALYVLWTRIRIPFLLW